MSNFLSVSGGFSTDKNYIQGSKTFDVIS